MIENDTIKLLRECDAGVKMGVSSITEVVNHVKDEKFRQSLKQCKTEHDKLSDEIQSLLQSYQDDGKSPNPIAKGMSWIKTNMTLMADDSDSSIADIMTDGCSMGVKSPARYFNQYEAADEYSKDIAKRIIGLEEQPGADIRRYL